MSVRFGDDGLVPAIVQDAETGRVLTLAWMNEESLGRTLDTGETWFWSRSRGELWHKGATSGNTQQVTGAATDCDEDAVVVAVRPAGPACHTGEDTCFHVPLTGTVGADAAPFAALPDLQAVVRARAADADPDSSYTASLLARGIDTAAHEGALDAAGRTAAVVGHGLDLTFPPEAVRLRAKMKADGCVLSEFPLGRPADRQTFPQRNRIVAGLVRVMVVVETDVDGGSMITARFAGDLGRTLCAVPGRADSPASRGCHALIRDGATLVSSVDDILTELGECRGQPALALVDDPPEFARWLPHFAGGAAHDAESLSALADCGVAEAAVSLTMMEIRGVLTRRPDGRHERA